MIVIKGKKLVRSSNKEKANTESVDQYFSEDALVRAKDHFNRSGSRERLFYMDIDDFLSLCRKGFDAAKERTVALCLRDSIPLESIPYLKVENKGDAEMDDSAKEWLVTGHGGRHRARAMQAMGIRLIPVMIIHSTMRWGRAKKRPQKVWAQEPRTNFVLYKDAFQEKA